MTWEPSRRRRLRRLERSLPPGSPTRELLQHAEVAELREWVDLFADDAPPDAVPDDLPPERRDQALELLAVWRARAAPEAAS